MEGEHLHAPFSCAWVAQGTPPKARETLDDAFRRMSEDPAWRSWIRENIDIEWTPKTPFHYLQLDDRATRRIMVKGDDVSFFEPASAAVAAAEKGELVAYFIELLEAFYRRYAEKTGRPAPPPSILA